MFNIVSVYKKSLPVPLLRCNERAISWENAPLAVPLIGNTAIDLNLKVRSLLSILVDDGLTCPITAALSSSLQ